MVTASKNLWSVFFSKKELINELVRRELKDRHAGQMLGTLWAFGHPLILMLVYTGLFAYVFPARFGTADFMQDYSTCVFAGIVPWLAFQDLLSRSPSILVSHASLVKQIVFPTEVLPIKTSIASGVPYLIGLVFALCYAAWHGRLSFFALTIFPLLICQFAAMAGVAFLLSASGVFFRDLRDVIQVFCTLNLFAQPILYNPFSTPAWFKIVFFLNPFSYLTWCWQDALFFGYAAHWYAWIVFTLGSFMILILGWMAFQRVRHLFGDAL